MTAGGTGAATPEPAARIEQILYGHFGHLRDRQFPVRAVLAAHDVADPGPGAVARLARKAAVGRGAVGRGFHRGEGGRVGQGEVPDPG